MEKLIVEDKAYTNENCIHNLINYITTDKETSRVIMIESFGVNSLNKDTIISSMIKAKEGVKKTSLPFGHQYL